MNREKAKATLNDEPKCSNGTILPDDKEIANRYIQWKNLVDKFNNIDEDDDGMSIEDALEWYGQTEGNYQANTQVEEALECDEDDDDKASSKSDYAALKNQLTVALQERNSEWKSNGMEVIFNSDFSLDVDYVQRWLKDCENGTGKQMTQERETRFTEYKGNTQLDVTRRENISILNEAAQKQLTSEQSSNYEFCDTDQRRVVVHQVQKTTISSFFTADPNQSNGHSGGTLLDLPLDSFLGNVSTFTPFKLPIHIKQLRPLTNDKNKAEKQLQERRTATTSAIDSGTLINLMENSLKLVPKSSVKNNVRTKRLQQHPKRRVHFKTNKIMHRFLSDSSESSDSDRSDNSDNAENESPVNIQKPTRRKIPPTIIISSDSENANSPCKAKGKVSPSPPAFVTIGKAKETSVCHTVIGNEKPPQEHTQNGQEYPMPANYRQMLSVNGRCRYKTSGTIIYRPKPIHTGLPREAEKILVKTQDLDLSGIKSSLRRKKFDNFSCQTHPNSVLVYYMSDSDDELCDAGQKRNSDEDSSDDDDPILSYKPQLCVLTFFNDGGTQPS